MMKFAKKEIKPAQKKEEQPTPPKPLPVISKEPIVIPKLTPPPAKQATKAPRPLPAVKNPPSKNPHNSTALPAPQISNAPEASAPPETGQEFLYASAPQQTGEFSYGHYAPPPTYEGQPGGVPAFNPYIPNAPPMSENPAVKQPAPVAFGFAPPSQLPAEDPNAKGEDGKTPLHRAVLAENKPEVERLLQLPGIDLTIADKDGSTALHYAAEIGSKNIANVLIEKNKALLGMKNLKGETPLAIANAKGHGYMADMLNPDSLFPADPFGNPFAAVLPAQPWGASPYASTTGNQGVTLTFDSDPAWNATLTSLMQNLSPNRLPQPQPSIATSWLSSTSSYHTSGSMSPMVMGQQPVPSQTPAPLPYAAVFSPNPVYQPQTPAYANVTPPYYGQSHVVGLGSQTGKGQGFIPGLQ